MIIEEKYNINKMLLIVNDIEVYPEEESLKDFLLMRAHLDINNHSSQTYLLFDDNDNQKELLGYYTLKTLEDDRLNYYPCVELSQILVDINHRNKGLGNSMINLALCKANKISDIAGCKLLIAFSLNDNSTFFYKN